MLGFEVTFTQVLAWANIHSASSVPLATDVPKGTDDAKDTGDAEGASEDDNEHAEGEDVEEAHSQVYTEVVARKHAPGATRKNAEVTEVNHALSI